MSLRIT